MENKEITEKLLFLEFEHDQLVSEYTDLDNLLRSIGFPSGIQSIKQVASDMIRECAESDKVSEN